MEIDPTFRPYWATEEIPPMTQEIIEAEDDIRTFCTNVGELVLWGSAIDAQLTTSVIILCSLAQSPMLEPVVAELGVQAKLQILRSNTKHIENPAWAKGIGKWLTDVESVNGFRNIVAHHQVVLTNGKLTLYSPQIRKILKRINKQELQPAKTLEDIKQWVEAAKRAYQEGQNVLANLNRFSEEVAKREADSSSRALGTLRISPRF